MDNSQVNAKKLNDVTNEMISIIDEVYYEINTLQQQSDVISALCVELKESDGKKIAVSGISTAEEISPQLGFKRCRVYGEKELEVQVGSLQKDLINILDSVDYIYTKLKLSLGVSEDIDKNVKNIESVLTSGAEAMVFQDYMTQQNGNLITPEQVSSAVESNFNQNRNLTNKVSNEVSLRVYEKLQGMLKSSGGDQL